MKRILCTAILAGVLLATWARAQDIPIDTWRLHPSFNSVNHVAADGNARVFAASSLGLMIVDRADNSLTTLTKLNGLHDGSITEIGYSVSLKTLIVSYSDGKFDVIQDDNEVTTFDPTAAHTLTTSKRINDIRIEDNLAYLSTDYGVVVFDLSRLQVKETWRDLGVKGATISIIQSIQEGDSIFLATAEGVIAGNLNQNLLDFNHWKRFNTGPLLNRVQAICSFNGKTYAAVNNEGLLVHQGGEWKVDPFFEGQTFVSLHSSTDRMYVIQPSQVWNVASSGEITALSDGNITQPYEVEEDNGGHLWIGDGNNGLLTNVSGTFDAMLPNGPSSAETTKLIAIGESMVALRGGYSNAATALGHDGVIDIFEGGMWTSSVLSSKDLTDYIEKDSKTYVSSFGYGVQQRLGEHTEILWDGNNSPLVNLNPPGKFTNVTALAPSSEGIWISNYAAATPLHLLDGNNTWHTFSFPQDASKFPLKMIVDNEGSVWMALDPLQGGGLLVFNGALNTSVYLTEATGKGGLPSRNINCLDVDRDGYVWVGTDLGVVFFVDPSAVFGTTVDAVKPVVDGRFLLRDDKVTAIAVDGGNRKWLGTERGLWLFSSTGEQLIYNFTSRNSPLPSDIIRDIEIIDRTGEVFFATDTGMASYRSNATGKDASFNSVKVFPNPVTARFSGTVGINGTPEDAIVKITDISGRLVWQTQANGTTASWNLQDNNGRRVPTGIYVVFTVTPDGKEHVASKIAVIE